MAAERGALLAFGFRDECEAAARPPHRPTADELNAENHGRPSSNLNNAATPRFTVRQGVSAAVARCFETTNKRLCMPWLNMQKAGHHTQGDPVAPLSSACHPQHRNRSHRSVFTVSNTHSQATDAVAGCTAAVIAEYGVLISTARCRRRSLLPIGVRLLLWGVGRHR